MARDFITVTSNGKSVRVDAVASTAEDTVRLINLIVANANQCFGVGIGFASTDEEEPAEEPAEAEPADADEGD